MPLKPKGSSLDIQSTPDHKVSAYIRLSCHAPVALHNTQHATPQMQPVLVISVAVQGCRPTVTLWHGATTMPLVPNYFHTHDIHLHMISLFETGCPFHRNIIFV